MTREEVDQIASDERRVRIAKLCGYKNPKPYFLEDGTWFETGMTKPRSVPDYPNDLNAMHEAKKLLSAEQHCHFIQNLVRKPWSDTWPFKELFLINTATALEQSAALLLTLG